MAEKRNSDSGDPIWAVIAGEPTWPHIAIAAGVKYRRTHTRKNTHLSEVYRHHDPDLDVYIQCLWTLACDGQVLISANDDVNVVPQLEEILIARIIQSFGVESSQSSGGTAGQVRMDSGYVLSMWMPGGPWLDGHLWTATRRSGVEYSCVMRSKNIVE